MCMKVIPKMLYKQYCVPHTLIKNMQYRIFAILQISQIFAILNVANIAYLQKLQIYNISNIVCLSRGCYLLGVRKMSMGPEWRNFHHLGMSNCKCVAYNSYGSGIPYYKHRSRFHQSQQCFPLERVCEDFDMRVVQAD